MGTIFLIGLNIITIIAFYSLCTYFIFKLFQIENNYKYVLKVSILQVSIVLILLTFWGIIELFFLSNANSPNDLDFVIFFAIVSGILYFIFYYYNLFNNKIDSIKTNIITFHIVYFLGIIGAYGITIFFRMNIYNFFHVWGEGMSPALKDGNIVVVNKLYYKFNKPQRGDIIVYKNPNSGHLGVKRIVGLVGETIIINNNQLQLCNGDCQQLEEKYLPEGTKTINYCNIDKFELKNGLFILGDNRLDSVDSRCCFSNKCEFKINYTLPVNNIVGKITMQITPNLKFHQ